MKTLSVWIEPILVDSKRRYKVIGAQQPMQRFRSNEGFYVYLTDPKIKNAVFKLLPMIERINQHIPDNSEEGKIRHIPVESLAFQPSDAPRMRGDATDWNIIRFHTNIFDMLMQRAHSQFSSHLLNLRVKATFLHEAMHKFFETLPQGERMAVVELYRSMIPHSTAFGKLEQNQKAMVLGSAKFIWGSIPDYLSEPLFSIFKESTYFPLGAPDIGHPITNYRELFVSTTNNLLLFHRHFFSELEGRLRRDAPGLVDIAFKAVQTIVSACGSAKLFSDEVYRKLGLPIPAENQEVASSAGT